MRIYRMTATFGKLEHETLTLKPDLNIITAPNEWGKSTWCAFLVAMLYGMDTRAKTTKTTLADKERYLPWSGSPMSGRIDLNWKGRDITIERNTKRRVPLGEFKAYETVSGLPVTELTASNCGQMLLGVEQTVYRRSGFIRHSDLPVTQDEALRRRLNSLVTTGDESGAADQLAGQLRDLRNRCRYNRTGLLPQAEAELEALGNKLEELENLETQSESMKGQLEELEESLVLLRNHRQALYYAKGQVDASLVEQAKAHWDAMQIELHAWEEACAELPPREEMAEKVQQLRTLKEQWDSLIQQERQLPREPEKPMEKEPFVGMTLEEGLDMVSRDTEAFFAAADTKLPKILLSIGVLGLVVAAVLVFMQAELFAWIAGAAAVVSIAWGIYETISGKRKTSELLKKYGDGNYKNWALPLQEYRRAMMEYQEHMTLRQEMSSGVSYRLETLEETREVLCGDQTLEAVIEAGQAGIDQWDALYRAKKEEATARDHYETLSAVAKPVEKPSLPDTMPFSEEETKQLMNEASEEQQRLQNRLGNYQGRMETLGTREEIQRQREALTQRIAQLEDTYLALTIAMEKLEEARAALQRRFAPRITKRAQKLLRRMTEGRYNGLTMGQDFSLQSRAGNEDVHHDTIWRSEGTVDQIYLALRLAVAEALMPEAPLVLDDALVRFDKHRMNAAVEILRDMSQKKQVILFTCQGREAQV